MKKVALYGGSFNPIHMGHLITANYVREIRGLDEIIFIPCYLSPHKTESAPIDAKFRLDMVRMAIADNPHFTLSDFELNRGGISYSIDTVKYFKETYDEIDLIIGYDNLLVFEKWKDPDELVKLVNLVVLRRSSDTGKSEQLNKYFSYANIVETPLIDISSSDIRDRIMKGKSIDYLVPEPVKVYIKQNNLYRE